MRRLLFAVVLITGASVGPSVPAAARRSLSLTFAQMPRNTLPWIKTIFADQANRIWVATANRVAGVLGDEGADGFPLNTSDFRDVAGGDVNVINVSFGNLLEDAGNGGG
jgi:hypothetical protein